jgi:O-antigen/teichoic acid export membrane protein
MVLGSALSLVATTRLARGLEVAAFGTLSVARGMGDYLSVVSSSGTPVIGARMLATRSADDNGDAIIAKVLSLQLLLAVVGSILMYVVSVALNKPDLVMLSVFVILATLLNTCNPDWVFTASENVRPMAILRLLGRGLFVLWVLLMVSSPHDIRFAGIGLLVEPTVVFVGLWWTLRRLPRFGAIFNGSPSLLEIVRLSVPAGFAQVARQLKTNIDVMVLTVFTTTLVVGYYAAAYRLVLFVNALASVFGSLILPRIARTHNKGDGWESTVRASLQATGWIGSLVVVAGVPVAASLLTLLFGPSYAPARPIMGILVAASGVLFMCYCLASIAVAMERVSKYAKAALGVAAFNLLGNLALVRLYGMYASAWLTLASEILLAGLLVLVLRDRLGRCLDLSWFARLAVSTVVTAVAAHLAAQLFSPWVVGVLAVAADVTLLFLLRVLTVQMFKQTVEELRSE